jgi:DNA-binding CsgD family transcriptional regulator/tetratricopeptide (TPR) repeat protein
VTRSSASSSGPPILVGRSRERSLLGAQLSAALAGRGGLVILSGEAGIGKTTLADDACREASAAGALVLVGRCYDGTETPPYGPWIELLRHFRGLDDRIPDLQSIPEPNMTHSSSQAALFGEVREFLVAVARVRLLVICLDDMHWADTASLDLLRFVARQLASVPILLLITYRSDEVTRAHLLYRLVPLLVREALAVRIDLSAVGDDDVRTLIDHIYQLPTSDTNRLVTYLQPRADGNPLFLGELLRSLEGTVLLPIATGGWRLGTFEQVRIPTLLRQVIDGRIERLGPEAATLLAVAAVIGQVVPIALWTAVGETTDEAILALVERTVEANIMDSHPDGLAVSFTHALIREALYESVLPPRRRVQHRRVGEALIAEETTPDPDAVAYHFSQSGDPRAVVWLTRAGERAQRAFAWQTATLRFQAALALLEEDPSAVNERGWLRFRLALLRRFEDPGAGVALLEEAERLGRATDDRALVAYARFHQGMLRCQGADFRRGIAAEEAGIAMLDALSPADRARLAAIDTTSDPFDEQHGRGELTLALAENGQLVRARALGEQILRLLPEQTRGSRGDAYYGLGFVYAALGKPDEAHMAFTHAREFFDANDYRGMVTASLFDELMVVTLRYWIDRPNALQGVETELRESFATQEAVFDQRSARSAGVVSSVLDGEWAEAFTMFEQGSIRFTRLATASLLAPLAYYQGNVALAWSLIYEGLPAGPDTAPEDTAGKILPLRTLAVVLSLDAADDDAARRWLAALDRWLDWSGSVVGQADAHLYWATYHRAVGDVAQARARAGDALTAAETPRQPLTLLATHRLIGELDLAAGSVTDAEAHLETALALADACGARHERALTLLVLADLLRVRGDLPTAREHLNTARAICTPMGAAVSVARADAIGARLHALSAARPTARSAGLTVRESEVLRLLATGLANAEIARQLSLSPRTIDTHLTNIYGKLGVTSRGAAIRFALDHDLA